MRLARHTSPMNFRYRIENTVKMRRGAKYIYISYVYLPGATATLRRKKGPT